MRMSVVDPGLLSDEDRWLPLHERAARVRALLEEAAVFERACDFTGAVATAQYAALCAVDPDSYDEAIIARDRHLAAERVWQSQNARRRDVYEERERRAAVSPC